MDMVGDFETHLTVALAVDDDAGRLRRWGEARGLKVVEIVLDRGATPRQPMLTWRARGDLAEQLGRAESGAKALRQAGFLVSRVKIEAAPTNPGVPIDDAGAGSEPPDRHFEHHVKLLLGPGADLAAITALAEAQGARLSRNAFKRRGDGLVERFVTQRCHGVGLRTAKARLDALLGALRARGERIEDVEQEYVVHDSHPGLDAGWLTPEPE